MNEPHIDQTPSGLAVVRQADGEQAPQGAGAEGAEEGGGEQAAVSEPGKLMRIAIMMRELQEEVRRADVDEAARDRLRTVHGRAVEALRSVLSGELREELDELSPPLPADQTPSESEIRVAQAQLVGWLEGLFQGIQAAIVTQQAAARQQLEQMRQHGLPQGGGQQQRGDPGAGQYL